MFKSSGSLEHATKVKMVPAGISLYSRAQREGAPIARYI